MYVLLLLLLFHAHGGYGMEGCWLVGDEQRGICV